MGGRIRNLRIRMEMKQKELADFMNVSSQVISNWERGYSSPNNEHVFMLAKLFMTSTDYLHGIVDNIFSDQLDVVTRSNVLTNNNHNEYVEKIPQSQQVSIDIIKLLQSSYGITMNNLVLNQQERDLLIEVIKSELAKQRLISQNILDQLEAELHIKYYLGQDGKIYK